MATTLTRSSDMPEVPANALVACPAERFQMVRIASHCLACQYWGGFQRGGETGSFGWDYRVVCAYPMTRSIMQFKED